MQTFNTRPRPESIIQNQRLLLETLCDIRRCLIEILSRTDWLKKAKPPKVTRIEIAKDEAATTLSKREEKALSFEERKKIISERAARQEAPTDEDVEAF